ncbi:FAD-dependent oxidoreductase [Actinocorallia sp. A-T 12471]|uniref:FAD-dependent oxidoreductase n=1 Tax=Actinocorallia sp. A-T 12471 TaxID=3089813 RepID=UPI0029CAD9CC|nr:FAD-dependent oxidoreductase [Actinocorallia sp. A-T 12471]MDX6740206.1 FAD-dependent oxidoreductase [Actinocorallia sp. A-T 12471]
MNSVLIVGAGVAGSALAILLRRGGVAVEIAEINPDLTALGSGITLQGNALRQLRDLGVWDRVRAAGYGFDTFAVRAPDGSLLAEMSDYRTGGDDLPATLGMNRPELAAILHDAVKESGATVRFGLTVASLTQSGERVDVRFSDGSAGTYDLVVGADGVRSHIRELIGIETRPEPVGMGIWRVHTRRPASVERTDLVYGGSCYIAGYCPTSDTEMYAYLVEDARPKGAVAPADMAAEMRRLAESYGGAWREIAEDLTDSARINYTWFESLLVDRPWNRGRVVVIGDAAHACPPTLAQGAAMCLEDAAVLAELILAGGPDLFATFMDRRYDRVKRVVEASVQLCAWQLAHTRDADVLGLMGEVAALLTERP